MELFETIIINIAVEYQVWDKSSVWCTSSSMQPGCVRTIETSGVPLMPAVGRKLPVNYFRMLGCWVKFLKDLSLPDSVP